MSDDDLSVSDAANRVIQLVRPTTWSMEFHGPTGRVRRLTIHDRDNDKIADALAAWLRGIGVEVVDEVVR